MKIFGNMVWIWNFSEVGSGSEINSSGSTTLPASRDRYFNGRVKGERVRNSAKTVLHTLYLLKQLPSLDSLPVNDLIYILGRRIRWSFFQCCGSGIVCLFDPWIRDG
jgi:hypothetical protein